MAKKKKLLEYEPPQRVSPLIAFSDEEREQREERVGLDEQDREYWVGSELGDICNQSYFKQKIFGG